MVYRCFDEQYWFEDSLCFLLTYYWTHQLLVLLPLFAKSKEHWRRYYLQYTLKHLPEFEFVVCICYVSCYHVHVSFYITHVLTYTYSDTNKRAFNPVARGAYVHLVMRAASNESSPDDRQEERMSTRRWEHCVATQWEQRVSSQWP